ncbi:hypothetical protein QQ045_015415 [Rhodiola kirilowii]
MSDRFYDSIIDMSSVADDDESHHLIYDVWMNGLCKSVQERREDFLRKIGVDGLAPVRDMAMERMTVCSGPAELIISQEQLPVKPAEGEIEICFAESSFAVERAPVKHPARLLSSSSRSSSEGSFKLSKNWINDKKRVVKWWRSLSGKWRSETGSGSESDLDAPSCSPASSKMNKVKVHSHNKSVIELSAVYTGQSFSAHCGMIRTMKFSPDGRYLASGGEDGVVRVWLVSSVDGSSKHATTGSNFGDDLQQGKALRRNKAKYASVVVPDKMIHIEESPLHEFYGHSGDVLNLAWSKSNILLSSSMDRTVRMWRVDCDDCLNIFPHCSYVTCIQFNPVDDNYFITGSLDRKVRIWKVSRGRVADWVDVRDAVTSISFHPDGRGFVVGTISGNCRFYRSLENRTQLDAEVHIDGASSNKITDIEFSAEATGRVMVTLENSKVHILEGAKAVDKCRVMSNLGKVMSALRAQHIVSVGEDSHVYVWNYNHTQTPSSEKVSLKSCEHFFCEGVSVAIPWAPEEKEVENQSSLERQNHLDTASLFRDIEPLIGVSRFSMDGSRRGKKSATWPAEQLLLSDSDHLHFLHQSPPRQHEHFKASSVAWGLVILTACYDGTIKTYHNLGLPVKL